MNQMTTKNNLSKSMVCFGEILWDVLPAGAMPGGAPMNVAYHLKKLNHEPKLITRVGHDKWGKELIQLMERCDISTDYFQMDHKLETGKVIANVHDRDRVTYDIIAPVAWDYIEWEASFENLLHECDGLIFGSLSTRNTQSRETLYQLIESAKKCILDINLRPPFFDKQTVEYLLSKADLLKLNLEELELITGWFAHFPSEQDRMQLLADKFNIPTIVVTKGSSGSVMLNENQLYRHKGFTVDVMDTIGSGDAFLAGFLSYYLDGSSPESALEYANALGALIATHRGACPEYDQEEIVSMIETKTNGYAYFKK